MVARLHIASVALLCCPWVTSATAQSVHGDGAEAQQKAVTPAGTPAVPATSAPAASGGRVAAVSPPAAAAPSLFQFSFHGAVALTLYAQDTPVATGNGLGALAVPLRIVGDSWFMGGDVRHTRISLGVRGPDLLGASTLATVDLEMTGGNQIYTVAAPPAVVTVRDAMGNVVGTGSAPGFASSAQGDESLLPRLRTAYVEFNWNAGENVLRAGQYHNLLLAMVSASGAHPATLGFGAGQLGWRAPGLTYAHKFKLTTDASLEVALQINRNSWNDNAPVCLAGMAPPANNCLPHGVSLGEAGLPQLEARVLLSGPMAESPWPLYAPTQWQLHLVAHWDRKDLSGVNAVAPRGVRDTLTTYAIEAGGKLKLGPLLVAANGWYGQNTGGVFGNVFQIQMPDKPDVRGFGVWGQIGVSIAQGFSVWAFAGTDRPQRDQALAAAFTRLSNAQIAGMLAYVNGPLTVTIEWLNIATQQPMAATSSATPGAPALPPTVATYRGNQPSFTLAYAF
jgi:hypothetical protein